MITRELGGAAQTVDQRRTDVSRRMEAGVSFDALLDSPSAAPAPTPAPSQAQADALTAQIEQLKAQFEALKAQIQVATATMSALTAAPRSTPLSDAGMAPTPAPASTPVSSRLSTTTLSMMRDTSAPMMELLPHTLTAGDPQYNDREAKLRGNLNLDVLERRLQDKARSMEVSYDRSDLEGVLRNAGYDSAHLGSTERYMAAVERLMGEAERRYTERSSNKSSRA